MPKELSEAESVAQLMATLGREGLAIALGVLEREAAAAAREISSSGRKTVSTEEPDSRRAMGEEVSILSATLQGLKLEQIVGLIKRSPRQESPAQGEP